MAESAAESMEEPEATPKDIEVQEGVEEVKPEEETKREPVAEAPVAGGGGAPVKVMHYGEFFQLFWVPKWCLITLERRFR